MIQPGSMLDRYVRLTLQVAGDANPQDAEMKQPQLIPKPKKRWRLKQPRKDDVRRRAELAEAQLAYLRTPRWWRLWNRLRVRVVETDPETAAAMPPMEDGGE